MNIKNDPKAIGAVVTTHKLKVFEHAGHLFDQFDELTKLAKEICTIAKRDSVLMGSAMPDCLSAALSLKDMLGTNYWQTYQSDVLCFGAGGFARSIALSLLFDFESSSPFTEHQLHKPRRLLLVDIDQRQLQSIQEFLAPIKKELDIRYIWQSNACSNDRLLAELPEGSLIVNATGMGKDRPGSPLTDEAVFPPKSVVWDLNYRGMRQFLKQARSQPARLELLVHDGWLCFLRGWTQALQSVLRQEFSCNQFRQLAETTEPFRIDFDLCEEEKLDRSRENQSLHHI